jgi:hypothetical protein
MKKQISVLNLIPGMNKPFIPKYNGPDWFKQRAEKKTKKKPFHKQASNLLAFCYFSSILSALAKRGCKPLDRKQQKALEQWLKEHSRRNWRAFNQHTINISKTIKNSIKEELKDYP